MNNSDMRIFTAEYLHLADLVGATVDVDDTLAPGTIGVSITGPAESTDEVRVRTEMSELHVSGPAGNGSAVISGGGVSIVSGNASVGMVIGSVHGGMVSFGNNTVIGSGSGNIVINGRRINLDDLPPAPAPARVRVAVRTGTPVTITDTAIGSYRIGSTHGDLRITGSSTNVQAGSVASTRIRANGTGDVTIAEVTGDRLDVRVSGLGSVSIDGGQVRQMAAKVSGNGSVEFGGTVSEFADLEISGVGGIGVHRVTGSVDRSVSGLGRINVRNRY